jgi:two-component system, NtrC family, response regulator HydG
MSRKRSRVLVVDDDVMMAKTLTEILQLRGWEVATAFDGVEAVAAATAERFDVVLMDIKMPGMNGVQAFKAMKAANPAAKVVLMTAYAAQELIGEAEREGVMRVLPKPVNVGALLEYLAGLLEAKHPLLLIDSDGAFLDTLDEVLRLRGYETMRASGIDEALALMNRQRPAAILLHMHMGSITSAEAVLAIHKVSPAVALILYSGQPDAAGKMAEQVPASLVTAYLQKPFAVDRLTGVLDAIGAG